GSGGASDRVVHLNRRLAECGLLGFRRASRGRVAGLVRAAALRAVPRRLQGALVRRAPAAAGRLEGLHRLAGIEWSRTVAYAEELDYHPSVWLNLRGREPEGVVDPAAYRATRGRVAAALVGWCDEAGRPIAAARDAEPRSAPDPLADTAPALRPFDDDETRDLEVRLAALGYLEPRGTSG